MLFRQLGSIAIFEKKIVFIFAVNIIVKFIQGLHDNPPLKVEPGFTNFGTFSTMRAWRIRAEQLVR